MPYYFAVYRFEGAGVGDFRDPKHLIASSAYNAEKWIYEDQTAVEGESYTYVVTAFNRVNVESYSSEPITVKKTRYGIAKSRKKWKLF